MNLSIEVTAIIKIYIFYKVFQNNFYTAKSYFFFKVYFVSNLNCRVKYDFAKFFVLLD